MHRALARMRAEGPDGPSRKLHILGQSRWLSSAKLKLVDACNLRCFMCDYWKGRRKDELSTQEVTQVLDGLQALGCEKVHFTGGELFIRKDALQLLEHAASRNMRTNLTSNGTLLDKAKIKHLTRIPVRSVTLSIDSPVPQIHDAVRGVDKAHKKTLATLDRFLALKKTKTRIRLNTVVSKQNYRSLIEMPELLRDRPVDGWLLIPMDPWVANDQQMDADDIAYFNAHVAPALEETLGVNPWVYGRGEADLKHAVQGDWARGFYRKNTCRVPWFHILVDAQGDVYPCCMTHTRLPPLGNVREASVADIFSGPKYVQFRQSMLQKRPSICNRCDDFLEENQAFADLEESWTKESPKP